MKYCEKHYAAYDGVCLDCEPPVAEATKPPRSGIRYVNHTSENFIYGPTPDIEAIRARHDEHVRAHMARYHTYLVGLKK